MHLLALDIGTRRTGVAFADTDIGIPLSLDTITHSSFSELEDRVLSLLEEKKIDRIIIGLPLLPSGDEGAQVRIVRSFADRLEKTGIPLSFLDERYTTPKNGSSDSETAAACSML